MPPELILWLKKFYEESQFTESNQEDFIIFSEGLRSESFYAGDFIFAGTINDLSHFCNAVLSTREVVHPMNASDTVLKWLQSIDSIYFGLLSPFKRSLLTARNSLDTQRLWHKALATRISMPPREIYTKIIWRGKAMPEVLQSSIDTHFFFNEDLASIKVSSREVRSIGKTYRLMRSYWKRYFDAKRAFKNLGPYKHD